MNLFAFDVDGTLECKEEKSEYINGPVKISTLVRLSIYNKIVIVSPSPYYPKHSDGVSLFPIFAEYESNTYRHKNLLDAEKSFPVDGLKIYVSDNGDHKEADKAGFIFITEKEFAKKYND